MNSTIAILDVSRFGSGMTNLLTVSLVIFTSITFLLSSHTGHSSFGQELSLELVEVKGCDDKAELVDTGNASTPVKRFSLIVVSPTGKS